VCLRNLILLPSYSLPKPVNTTAKSKWGTSRSTVRGRLHLVAWIVYLHSARPNFEEDGETRTVHRRRLWNTIKHAEKQVGGLHGGFLM
jgi:hypothetical protein